MYLLYQRKLHFQQCRICCCQNDFVLSDLAFIEATLIPQKSPKIKREENRVLPVSWANNTKDISRYTLTRWNSLIFVDLEAQGYNQLIYHGKSPVFFKTKITSALSKLLHCWIMVSYILRFLLIWCVYFIFLIQVWLRFSDTEIN